MDLIQLDRDVVSSVVYDMHTKVLCRPLSKFKLQWFPTRGGRVSKALFGRRLVFTYERTVFVSWLH